MSKLKIIQQELEAKEANKEIFIAPIDVSPEVHPINYKRGLEDGYCVDICVAPINGMYLPDELNKFMNGLISVEPERKRPFSLWRDFELSRWEFKHTYRLYLGWMSFIEKIGQKRIDGETIRLVLSRNLEAENLEELIKEVIPDGTPGVDIDMYRQILLRVYPNFEIAKKKFCRNDFGAEMTQYHIKEFVPNIKPIYELFEKTYADRKRDPTPMEEVGSNIRPIVQVKVQ